jgi:hypothetical protein
MNDLVADVQAYLVSLGLVDGSTGWPSTRGAMHDEADQIVGVAEDVGPEPEVPAAEGLGSAALYRPAVQVRVRAAADDRDAAFAKAKAIHEALHGLTGVAMGGNTYMLVRARSSAFARFYDERSRPNYTMSYLATVAAVA